MEDIDLSDHKVTSEVHVFSEGEPLNEDDTSIGKTPSYKKGIYGRLIQRLSCFLSKVISSFKFTLPANVRPSSIAPEKENPSHSTVDEDGDPIIIRKNHTDDHSLTISNRFFDLYYIRWDAFKTILVIPFFSPSRKHKFRPCWTTSLAWSTFAC